MVRGAAIAERSMLRHYNFWQGTWRRSWRELGCGSGEKGQDIGPFGLSLREIAKNFRDRGPGAEAAFDGAGVVFSEAAIRAARGYLAVSADDACPIFEQFTVREALVDCAGLKSGGPNGVIPTREE